MVDLTAWATVSLRRYARAFRLTCLDAGVVAAAAAVVVVVAVVAAEAADGAVWEIEACLARPGAVSAIVLLAQWMLLSASRSKHPQQAEHRRVHWKEELKNGRLETGREGKRGRASFLITTISTGSVSPCLAMSCGGQKREERRDKQGAVAGGDREDAKDEPQSTAGNNQDMSTQNSPKSVTSGMSLTSPRSPTRSERKGKRMAPPPPPPHLSEFLSYVNGGSSGSNGSGEMDMDEGKLELNKAKQHKSGRKKRTDNASWSIHSNMSNPSLASMPSITPTTMALDVLVTKKDVAESVEQMQELSRCCETLSQKLKEASDAFGDFGAVMEKISRSKGSGEHCDALSTFSNYQYLISNQHRYLGELLHREFGNKIGDIRREYEGRNEVRREQFQDEYKKLVKELKSSEVANSKLRKGKIRNLVSYKTNLANLTNKLDNIDRVYHDYYVDSYELIEEASGKIAERARQVVRQESVVFGKLAEKTRPGNGLDVLFAEDSDVAVQEEAEEEEDEYVEDGDTTIREDQTEAEPQEGAGPAAPAVLEDNDDGGNDGDNDGDADMEEEDIGKRDEQYMQHAVELLRREHDDSAIEGLDGTQQLSSL